MMKVLGNILLVGICLTVGGMFYPKDTLAEEKPIFATDGPSMANPSMWKHKLLDGAWMNPEGTCSLDISGFDYKLGVYQKDEPNHFVNYNSRFYFLRDDVADSKKEIELHLSLGSNNIVDSKEKLIGELERMHYKNGTIYVTVKLAEKKEKVVWQLRRPSTICE